ncbi:MAG: tetratricopeptide repeat protein [Polyangiaceae bacterium]
MKTLSKSLLVSGLALSVVVSSAACGGPMVVKGPADIATLRSEGAAGDREAAGRWLLGEMFEPGGTAERAAEARAKLAKMPRGGFHASLARGIYDETHGEPVPASDSFLAVLEEASASSDPDAELAAWYAAVHLTTLRGNVPHLYKTHRQMVERLSRNPGRLGWRAVSTLLEWGVAENADEPAGTADDLDKRITNMLGCVRNIRLAGPFGQGSAADRRRSFPPETAAAWPLTWARDPVRGIVPRVLDSEQPRCVATIKQRAGDGIYYAETFVDVPADRDVIVAVQSSVKVWVDDQPVIERDLRQWGIWQRFGAFVHMPKGRHRIVARLMSDGTTIRLLNPDGTASGITGDADATKPYGLSPVTVLSAINPLDVRFPKLTKGELPPASALSRILAAHAAHGEGMDDVASWLIEPITQAGDAAGVTLEHASIYARGDAAMPTDVRRRTERAYHSKAILRDPLLWYSQTWLVLDDASQRGATEAVRPLRALVAKLPHQPDIMAELVRLYGRLGWRAERMRALKDLTAAFPENTSILELYRDALEDDGALAEADALGERIKKLDPDSEIDLTRALARQDYPRAIVELKRIGAKHPDRKDIASKLADVLLRSGDPTAALEQLAKALAKNPGDADLRLRLADREFAKGDKTALRRALADVLRAGGKGKELRDALELIEGVTNLEPYRIDGRKVIREFEAWEKSGKRMAGSSARVLDYSSVWVHGDGTSEMLEHEIVKVQSQEAIGKEAEQNPPEGLVLRVRVIKPSGQILEPEQVQGKQTLTMPHLELGDYIETEHVTTSPSEAQGERYRGPTWFFREADKGYWRSEFVCITPKSRELTIESRGAVPKPTITERGPFTERRWVVIESPPAIEEPDSVPAVEFLPSVRIGWGQTWEHTLARLADAAIDETPFDPRLQKQVLEVVKGVPEKASTERAKKLYRDILSHVEDGRESDGRRVLTGKSGSRQAAFLYGLRLLGIDTDFAIVKNRLAMPPKSALSEGDPWDSLVLRVHTDRGPRWLTVRDKFAPFGYVPADLRDQPAIILKPELPKATVHADGTADSFRVEGRADLREDGSATVNLRESFVGRLGISMRNVLEKVPEANLADFVETRLLAGILPGARVREVKVEGASDLDAPVALVIKAEVSRLARAQGQGLALRPISPLQLSSFASLATRQTPLLISSSSHVEVSLEVVVPQTMKVPPSLPVGEWKDGDRTVSVKDRVEGHTLRLERIADVPAGRVAPGDEYAKFAEFARTGSAVMESEILLGR